MSAPTSIDKLSHEEIRHWLRRALQGQEHLPLLAPDEASHVAILRVDRQATARASGALRHACLVLVQEFCAEGRANGYLQELLLLAASFNEPEVTQMLAQFAEKSSAFPLLELEIRRAVLTALVDMVPPQDPPFWCTIQRQAPNEYSGLVLSGLLATNPNHAVKLLPQFPDDGAVGQAVALKLDLAWDDLPPKKRSRFVADIDAILPKCGANFARAVNEWAESKGKDYASANEGLRAALNVFLGREAAAKALTPKLCHELASAA